MNKRDFKEVQNHLWKAYNIVSSNYSITAEQYNAAKKDIDDIAAYLNKLPKRE